MKFPLLFVLLALFQPAFAAAIPVRVAVVEQTTHAAERHVPGRIEAIHTVEIKARTEGVITQVHFRDGQYVKKVTCCLNWTMPSHAPPCVWHRLR